VILLRVRPQRRKDVGELRRVRRDLQVVVPVSRCEYDEERGRRRRKGERTCCPTRSMTTPSVWLSRILESLSSTSPNSCTISSMALGRSGTNASWSKSHVSHRARLRAAVSRIAGSVEALRDKRWTRSW